jgi:hypothetical protein
VRRAILAAGVFAVVLALLASCSDKARPARFFPGEAAQPLVSGALNPGPQGVMASPTGPSAKTCTASQLTLTQPAETGHANGYSVVAIRLTNKSAARCSVQGYPVFTLVAHSVALGSDIEEAITIAPGGLTGLDAFSHLPGQVVLGAGGRGGFLLGYSEKPQNGVQGCPQATRLSLTLPTGPTPVAGPVKVTVCGQPIRVSPFVESDELSVH